MELTIYVPNPDGPLAISDIVKGSGIVGSNSAEWLAAKFGRGVERGADDSLLIDYEGNVYGADNIRTFADRVMVAAGRHSTYYPTVARMMVDPGDVLDVAEWRSGESLIVLHDTLPHDVGQLLADWIGVTTEDELYEQLAVSS